jgi:hypothetical protein
MIGHYFERRYMKTILGFGLALIIAGGLAGCTSDNSANLRNENNNTAYLTSSPTPRPTSTPISNYNASNTGGTNAMINSNHVSNVNSTKNTGANAKTNSNTKGNSNH